MAYFDAQTPVNNFLNAYTAFKNQGIERENNQLFGQMVSGDMAAAEQLAQRNPELFGRGQKQIAMQQESENQARMAQEQLRKQDQAMILNKIIRSTDDNVALQLAQQGVQNQLFDSDDVNALISVGPDGGITVDRMRAVDGIKMLGHENLLPNQFRGGSDQGLPSSVQETLWYNQQTPEVQKAHMDLKRRAEQSPEAKLAYQKQLNEIKLQLEKQKLLLESNVSADTSEQDANTLAEIEAGKKLGSLRGDILTDETKSFRNVRSQKLQLNQLEKALEAAETGKYAQLKSFAGKYMPWVDVDNEQALQSIVTQYALSELQKQTGPKTDFDFIKAAETQVQAGNTKGANKIILDRMRENVKYSEDRYEAFKAFKKDRKDYENFEETFSYDSLGGSSNDPSGDVDISALEVKHGIK